MVATVVKPNLNTKCMDVLLRYDHWLEDTEEAEYLDSGQALAMLDELAQLAQELILSLNVEEL